MPNYRHGTQRRFHTIRYGYRHWAQHQDGVRHPHRRRKKKRRVTRHLHMPERRTVVLLGGGIGLIVLFLAIQSGYALFKANHQVSNAQSHFASLVANKSALLTPEGRKQAAEDLSNISSDAAAASGTLDSSIGLKFFGVFPIIGTQINGAKDLVSDVSHFSNKSMQMVVAADALAQVSTGTYVDLTKLDELRKQVGINALYFKSFIRPTDGLYGPVASARRRFNTIDQNVNALLLQGYGGLDYAERFLGLFGAKNYLIAGENQAEMRDGGAVLSWAILSTHDGHYDVNLAQSVGKLQLYKPSGYPIPAGTNAVYGPLLPTQIWQSTNATGDFSLSGQFMSSMFTAATHRSVDGVIGLDVSALQGLLRLTGPVHIAPVRGPIDSGNVVDVLLHRFYQDNRGSSQDVRHDEIASVAQAAVKKMNSTHVDVARLIRMLAEASAGRHIMIWDASPAREGLVTAYGGSGKLATKDPTATFHLSVQSGVAAKLDYYTRIRENVAVTVDASGNAFVTTTATITNLAPAGQGPSYQLGPDHVNAFRPGDYVGRVYLYSPRGSSVAGGVSESGLVLNGPIPAKVAPQQTTSVKFQTILFGAVKDHQLHLRFVPQGVLHPVPLTVTINAPQWTPTLKEQTTVLDRTRTIDFSL